MFTTTLVIQLVFDIVVLGVIIFAAFSDAKTGFVPWWSIWTILGLAVLHTVFAFGHYGMKEGFLYLGTGVGMALIYFIMVLISKGRGIGGADSKVTSALSLYLGLWPAVIMVVVHALSAIIYKAFMSARKQKVVKSVRLMVFVAIGYVAAKIFEWVSIIVTLNT